MFELNGVIDESDSFLNKLVQANWSDFYEKPVYIEKLRTTNAFGKEHMWRSAPNIGVACIQITNACDVNCVDCLRFHCPACRTGDSTNQLTFEQFEAILNNVISYGAQSVILTGGNPVRHNEFRHILKHTKTKVKNVFVHVPNIESANKVIGLSNILLTVFQESDIPFISKLNNTNNYLLEIYRPTHIPAFTFVKNNVAVKNSSLKNRIITSQNVYSKKTGVFNFIHKTLYNYCLYGKVTITCEGMVIPCLGYNQMPLGSALNDQFPQAMKSLVNDYWNLDIDHNTNIQCSKCEYRYVCENMCALGQSAEEQCTYDLEAGEWK